MQLEIFKPRELQVKPPEGSNSPRLWVRRLVIWSEPGTVIRDIPFGPGLNIIWSPDPADYATRRKDDKSPAGPGHGAGKTLVCRLLRYCLGEPHFAPDILHDKISGAFKDGRVGAEVVVDGVVWAVVRSIGIRKHDVVLEGGTLEAAVSPNATTTGMSSFVETLAKHFLAPDVVSLVADSPERAWLLTIAWLSRDQECRFGKITEWRDVGSDSGSPARKLSVSDATNVVRALLGAITQRETRLENDIAEADHKRADAAYESERQEWIISQSIRRIVKSLELRGQTLPEGPLLAGLLRKAARDRVACVSRVDAKGEIVSLEELEARYENEREEVQRIEREISSAENARITAEAVAKLIMSETPGLTARLDEAEAPTCQVCEVPIDRALAEGCKLSHKLPDLPTLRERRNKNAEDLSAQQAKMQRAMDTLARLVPELEASKVRRDNAAEEVRAARKLRNERTETWYMARRIGDDITELEKLLAQKSTTEYRLSDFDRTLKRKREAVGAERELHTQVFARLEEHFDPLVRRFVGQDARGRVNHGGNGLHLVVEYGGERSTPAIDSLKVLAFDLATLCRSIEGGTHLPALLVHDSPREADLGLSIYHALFHLVVELENVGTGPLFQYIVTTTTRPPDDLVDDPRVRLKLNGAPERERLLRRDL